MKYYLFGSGSKGNCILIESRNTNIIIDCGLGKRYLDKCFHCIGKETDDVDAVFLTHIHSDHISKIDIFDGKPFYSPFNIETTDLHLIQPNNDILIQDLRISVLALSHDADICVGYVIFDGNEKLVYITDTGYLRQDYYPLIKNADYIILESNHDVDMLMKTSRPYLLKQRILGDEGHLSNDACAEILKDIVGEKTKEVTLAHISEEANDPKLAFESASRVIDTEKIRLQVAKQREMVTGGKSCAS